MILLIEPRAVFMWRIAACSGCASMAELAIKKLVRSHVPIVGIIYGYVAGDLAIIIERLQQKTLRSWWQRFLVLGDILIWRDTPGGRLADDFDTEDELEADLCERVPNFVNPLHTLMWSDRYVPSNLSHDYEANKAFRVMIEFLGAPDFKCMFHS